jgi:hypothetical protein
VQIRQYHRDRAHDSARRTGLQLESVTDCCASRFETETGVSHVEPGGRQSQLFARHIPRQYDEVLVVPVIVAVHRVSRDEHDDRAAGVQ